MGILGYSSPIVASKLLKRDRNYDIIKGNRIVRSTILSTFYIRDKQDGI